MLVTILPYVHPDGYAEGLLPLVDAKAHLRVDDDQDDDLIAFFRDSAIMAVEKHCAVRLGPMTDMTARFARFGDGMRAGIGPTGTMSVSAISYLDDAGASQTMTEGQWRLSVDDALLPAIGQCWPSGAPVTVTFDAGFANGLCPPPLIAAAKVMVAHMFANREGAIDGGKDMTLPPLAAWLCAPWARAVL